MGTALLVGGTWNGGTADARGQWWCPPSAFTNFLEANGVEILGRDRPFQWSGNIGGLWKWCAKRKHSDWRAAGANLYAYLCPPITSHYGHHRDEEGYVPIAERNIIALSHGGQVVAYALSGGLKVHNLITIGTPVRDDMLSVWEKGTKNITGSWLHITEANWKRNLWAVLGTFFDGDHKWTYTFPFDKTHNVVMEGIGHSKVVADPDFFKLWLEQRWIERLR